MNKMVSYNSINQFRDVVKQVQNKAHYVGKDENGNTVYDLNREKPIITFFATEKIHGTNAGVTLNSRGQLFAQSRNRILSLESDNNGFAAWVLQPERKEFFMQLLTPLIQNTSYESVTVVGEWAGEGIQKGVAISQVPKQFYVFDIIYTTLDSESNQIKTYSHDYNQFLNHELGIYNMKEFYNFFFMIDFNNPEQYINKIVDATLEVEKESPVGKYFGISGIGEGLVYTGWDNDGNRYTFKSKGEKHSVSKVKTVSKVDEIKIASTKEFVNQVVTENRLNQGLDYFKEMGIEDTNKNLGEYIKWITNDVLKEETDVILTNQFDFKQVKTQIANIARNFYLNR